MSKTVCVCVCACVSDADLPVVVTSAPLFTTKSQLLPGSCFVVGYDTAIRLVMPKYYNNSEAEMLVQFAT